MHAMIAQSKLITLYLQSALRRGVSYRCKSPPIPSLTSSFPSPLLRSIVTPTPRPHAYNTQPTTMTEQSTFGTLSTAPTVPPTRPHTVVISGPSGVGKDAVIRRLQAKRPDLHFVVTATSRPMRPGEAHGIDYFFVSREQFEGWIEEGQLLEHAVVYGEYKGIPREQVEGALARGTDVILRIDVQGAQTMRTLLPGLLTVFIVAESEKELVERLVSRKTETEERMAVRVATAREEMARVGEFDYVVVNRDGAMEETVEQIEAILVAEKLRVPRRLAVGAKEEDGTTIQTSS